MEQIDVSSVTPFYTFDPLQGTEVVEFIGLVNDCHKGIDQFDQIEEKCPIISAKLKLKKLLFLKK